MARPPATAGNLGHLLFRLRTSLGITQTELAELAHMSRGHYSKLETGHEASSRSLKGLVKALPEHESVLVAAYNRDATDRWNSSIHSGSIQRQHIESKFPRLPPGAVTTQRLDALIIVTDRHMVAEETRTFQSGIDDLSSLYWTLVSENASFTKEDVVLLGIFGVKPEVLESESAFIARLDLPRPLSTGETATYRLQISLTNGKYPDPLWLRTPTRPVETLSVRLKFIGEKPDALLAIHGESAIAIEEPNYGERRELDSLGEAFERWSNLEQGYTYGFKWNWPSAGN